MNDLGATIKHLRTEHKMTQPDLAKIIGVSNGMISFWENNVCEPTASNIIKLCQVFDVSADYLLGLKDEG